MVELLYFTAKGVYFSFQIHRNEHWLLLSVSNVNITVQ